MLRLCGVLTLALAATAAVPSADPPGVVLPGGDGVGKGKHVVLVSGDQEYRSEEAVPQLAKILSTRHGFRTTTLFTVDTNGHVDPHVNNIPGLEALKTADLLVIFTRFLDLPDEQMRHFADYLDAGKPVVGLRTATHAFNVGKGKAYARFGNGSTEAGWEGGFGRRVLGEKWVAHHGAHGKEGTRGVIAPGQERHPVVRGLTPGSVFGTTDVYTVSNPLPGDSLPLVLGEVTETLQPDSKAVAGKKNDPMMPVAWVKTYEGADGRRGRVFTTTMGASQDLAHEGTRRLVVNGCVWAAGLEVPEKADVGLVGSYSPTPFKNPGHKKGQTPRDCFN